MSDEQKPDGFMIHGPEPFIQGKIELYDTEERAENILLDVFGLSYGAKGWRIRPVKIVFLDEEAAK